MIRSQNIAQKNDQDITDTKKQNTPENEKMLDARQIFLRKRSESTPIPKDINKNSATSCSGVIQRLKGVSAELNLCPSLSVDLNDVY